MPTSRRYSVTDQELPTAIRSRAQIFATILADYMTNSSLAGTAAASYGFTVSSSGTAARTYNVGSFGAALGLSNNTSYTIQRLLMAANAATVNGVVSLWAKQAAAGARSSVPSIRSAISTETTTANRALLRRRFSPGTPPRPHGSRRECPRCSRPARRPTSGAECGGSKRGLPARVKALGSTIPRRAKTLKRRARTSMNSIGFAELSTRA